MKNIFNRILILGSNLKLFLFSLCLALVFVCFTIIIAGSIYDTSDDLAMRSILEGKMTAYYPSNLLMYSNALWGLVLLNLPIPENFFLDRYSVGLIACIIWSVCLMINSILISKQNTYFKLFILSVILIPVIIRPQYTIIAGLLTIAGAMWLKALNFKTNRNFGALLIPAFSFLLAYFLRDKMFFVVFAIGLPIWFSFEYLKYFKFYVLIAIIAFSVSLSYNYNKTAYESEKIYKSVEKAKILEPFFDYHFGRKLLKKSNEDLLKKSKLSVNDIKLMEAGFFDFPEINNNLKNLQQIENYYFENRDYISSRLQTARLSLNYLLDPRFVLLVLVIILLPFIIPEKDIWRMALSVYLGLIFFIYLGYIQRAGLSRVYIPILLAIFLPWVNIFSSFPVKTVAFWAKSLIICLVLVHFSNEVRLHAKRVGESNFMIAKFKNLKISDFVLWGSLPIELIHPVFPRSDLDYHKYKSVGFTDEGLNANYDMVEGSVTKTLLGGESLCFAAPVHNLELLKNYFAEYHNKELVFEKLDVADELNLFMVKVQ
jgi:hypothetical protein